LRTPASHLRMKATDRAPSAVIPHEVSRNMSAADTEALGWCRGTFRVGFSRLRDHANFCVLNTDSIRIHVIYNFRNHNVLYDAERFRVLLWITLCRTNKWLLGTQSGIASSLFNPVPVSLKGRLDAVVKSTFALSGRGSIDQLF